METPSRGGSAAPDGRLLVLGMQVVLPPRGGTGRFDSAVMLGAGAGFDSRRRSEGVLLAHDIKQSNSGTAVPCRGLG